MKVKIAQIWCYENINKVICYIYSLEREEVGMKIDFFRDWDYKSAFDGTMYVFYTDIFCI